MGKQNTDLPPGSEDHTRGLQVPLFSEFLQLNWVSQDYCIHYQFRQEALADCDNLQIKRLGENSIYIVFRVYDLYKTTIGLRIYVDPLKLENQGKLQFHRNEYRRCYRVVPA